MQLNLSNVGEGQKESIGIIKLYLRGGIQLKWVCARLISTLLYFVTKIAEFKIILYAKSIIATVRKARLCDRNEEVWKGM